MKVELIMTISGVGKVGELVNVSDAYARNYLLPKKMAKLATGAVIDRFQKQQIKQQAAVEKLTASLEQARRKLTGVNIRLTAKASPGGRLFAAIHDRDIISELERQCGVKLTGVICDRKIIKTTGNHQINLVWPDSANTKNSLIIESAT
jgi:large subunit ribosomal protein L9